MANKQEIEAVAAAIAEMDTSIPRVCDYDRYLARIAIRALDLARKKRKK